MNNSKVIRRFEDLCSTKVTDTTYIVLSKGYENGVMKGFYLGKKYEIKDTSDKEKIVTKFAPGAYRIDTFDQFNELVNNLVNIRDDLEKSC